VRWSRALLILKPEWDTLDRRVNAARAILNAALAIATSGRVDGFTDISNLPPEVTAALEDVRMRAPALRRLRGESEPTFMAIPMRLADPRDRAIFVAFAPYSIHAELLDPDGKRILQLDDASSSIEVSAPVSVFDALLRNLPEDVAVQRLR